MKHVWIIGWWLAGCVSALAAAKPAAPAAPPPLEQHMVAVAHLDTQWRWTVRESIDPYLGNTLQMNFALFDQYPSYVFNFEGAFRYMLMKEYYPAEYEQMKRFVQAGRWHVAGPALDALDVNIPSPESVIRSILHAQHFYRTEFGLTARDLFLPDCFGFGYTLPTIAAHTGLKGFSTQKLGWGSSIGIPFLLGAWQGIDGSLLPSVLHGGPYNLQVREDLSKRPTWIQGLREQQAKTGFGIGFRYFGTGDEGGAPDASSMAWVDNSAKSDGPLRVRFASSSALFDALTPAHLAKLPRYRGEILLTRHGVGGYTSYGPIKQWSRQNEHLSAAAERAAAAAMALAGADYPSSVLRDAWIRFGWHHQHDGITGTSIPAANDIMMNDQIVSQIQFSDVLNEAVTRWAAHLDTRGPGRPVVVYNAADQRRTDLVEMAWPLADTVTAVTVQGPEGAAPWQRIEHPGEPPRLLFRATVPAVGLAVYHVVPATDAPPVPIASAITAVTGQLESASVRVEINADGQLSAVTDRRTGRSWLRGPVAWQFLPDNPREWPAWEIELHDIMAAPRPVLGRPERVEILENGPLRSALRVVHRHGETTVAQDLFLEESDGKPRIVVDARMEWHTHSNLLKVAFPVRLKQPVATYDLGIGAIERGINSVNLYEVPAQQWAMLGERDGSFGLAVLSEYKAGWDRPAADTIRLSMIHSPGDATTDFGTHRVRFALVGHEGGWSNGLHQAAEQFALPLLAFATEAHDGRWTGASSLLRIKPEGVHLLALKKEENGRRLVIRLAEMEGKPRGAVAVNFPGGVIHSAREINGLEDDLGPAEFSEGTLLASFAPFQVKAWAIELAPPRVVPAAIACLPIALPYDVDLVDDTGEPHQRAARIPASQFPTNLQAGAVSFTLGPVGRNRDNAWRCRGQILAIDNPSAATHVEVLAASLSGDRATTWKSGTNTLALIVPSLVEPVGRWDQILAERDDQPASRRDALVKDASIAWNSTHLIGRDGQRMPYQFAYLFRFRIPLDPSSRQVTLPDDPAVVVFAASAVRDPAAPCRPLNSLREPPTGHALRGSSGTWALLLKVGLGLAGFALLAIGGWAAFAAWNSRRAA